MGLLADAVLFEVKFTENVIVKRYIRYVFSYSPHAMLLFFTALWWRGASLWFLAAAASAS